MTWTSLEREKMPKTGYVAEGHSASPAYKRRMIVEIIDLARTITANGGGHIRFVPDAETVNTSRKWREIYRYGKKE